MPAAVESTELANKEIVKLREQLMAYEQTDCGQLRAEITKLRSELQQKDEVMGRDGKAILRVKDKIIKSSFQQIKEMAEAEELAKEEIAILREQLHSDLQAPSGNVVSKIA